MAVKTLKQIINDMFRNRYERTRNGEELRTFFYRYIGVEDTNIYNDLLKTLENKCNENNEVTLIFDKQIPFEPDMELLQYIFNELSHMDINHMVNQDINLFQNPEINSKFLSALDYIIPIAREKENFFNSNVLNNFIAKQILWAHTFLCKIKYDYDITPKCIYYGPISRHEIYFLIIMNFMGFDVLYINPLKEELWDEIEGNRLSQKIQNLAILQIESFKERTSKGKVIENVETLTKQIEREVQEQLFTGTGMYAPWQFRGGYTRSILLDTILEDIMVYLREPAKLRDGFRVDDNVVSIPCLFKKIDGVDRNIQEYQRILKYCVESPGTLVCLNNEILDEGIVNDAVYQLMFCQLSDGTFDIEEIKKLPIYKFSKYNEDVQNFLLKKMNEVLKRKDIFVKEFDREGKLKFVDMILSLNEKIIRLIDNFDYTDQIPKLVIFIEKDNTISPPMQELLGYLHVVGMDIIIFNPSGALNLKHVLKSEVFTEERMHEMKYDINYNSIINFKQGLFARIFK